MKYPLAAVALCTVLGLFSLEKSPAGKTKSDGHMTQPTKANAEPTPAAHATEQGKA